MAQPSEGLCVTYVPDPCSHIPFTCIFLSKVNILLWNLVLCIYLCLFAYLFYCGTGDESQDMKGVKYIFDSQLWSHCIKKKKITSLVFSILG